MSVADIKYIFKKNTLQCYLPIVTRGFAFSIVLTGIADLAQIVVLTSVSVVTRATFACRFIVP